MQFGDGYYSVLRKLLKHALNIRDGKSSVFFAGIANVLCFETNMVYTNLFLFDLHTFGGPVCGIWLRHEVM
jgi:hypothetical protein